MHGWTSCNEILVGVDPEASNLLPLAWASDEAHRRQLGLRLLLAVPPLHDTHHVDTEPQRLHLHGRGKTVLDESVDFVQRRRRDLRVVTELVDGLPAGEVVARTNNARLTVLGSRRLGRIATALSTSSLVLPVCSHARSPVVVVHGAEHTSSRPPFLAVGVDDGPAARTALDEAYDMAALRGAALHVHWLGRAADAHVGRRGIDVEAGRQLLSETLSGYAERYPEVPVEREVVGEDPVQGMTVESEHAVAAVVGRGSGAGILRGRAGPVTQALLRQSWCPVVVTPA